MGTPVTPLCNIFFYCFYNSKLPNLEGGRGSYLPLKYEEFREYRRGLINPRGGLPWLKRMSLRRVIMPATMGEEPEALKFF
jgi:hypothetical protein